jgi:hypothetical protein
MLSRWLMIASYGPNPRGAAKIGKRTCKSSKRTTKTKLVLVDTPNSQAEFMR